MPKWEKKYTAYERKSSDPFAGDLTETILVKDNTIVAHFRAWEEPSVQEDHNPARDGLVGTNWKKARPKSFRKCSNQARVLDWAVEAMHEWK
jgi:hypothetical protein